MADDALCHFYVREGDSWPTDVPRSLGSSRNAKTLVHVSSRDTGTGLDIWWVDWFGNVEDAEA